MANVEAAERSLLGSVMLTSGRVLDDLQIEAADFQEPKHETIWRVMTDMRSRGKATDLVTVGTAVMRELSDADRRGITQEWLHEVYQQTITSANAEYYAEIVRDEAKRRRIRETGVRIVQMADSIPEVEHLVDSARAELDTAAKANTSSVKSMGETIDGTLERLEQPVRFIPTPWGALNHLIGGWRPGGLYVIGARPGSGKSLVGLQSAVIAAQKGSVSFSTMEMSRDEIHHRVIAQTAGVEARALARGDLAKEDWARIGKARDMWERLPLFVDDSSGVTINQIKAFARSVARRQPLSMVVVDYLQLMRGQRGDHRDRHVVVGEWSRELKIFARDMGVPILALSQLNRASETRSDKRPTMADLRESGSIEQDADVVMLLQHDEDNKPDELNVLVEKNRQGSTGAFVLTWQAYNSRVVDQVWSPTQSLDRRTA